MYKVSIKKILLFSILTLAQIFSGIAGNNSGDSFKALFAVAKQDTAKVTILINWAESKIASNPDTALILSERALNLCGTLLKDTSEESGIKNPVLLQKTIVLNDIGNIYSNYGNNTAALDSYLKSLEILEKLNYKNELAVTLTNLGHQYYLQANASPALKYLLKGLKIQEEIGNKNGIATSMNYLGSVYLSQEDTVKSLECYFRSLKLNEEMENKKGIAQSLGTIGFVYKQKGVIAKALEYYGKSLKITEEIGDDAGAANLLNNMGVIYRSQGNYEEALAYFDRSFKLYTQLREIRGEANALANLGSIYFKKNDFPKAEQILLESLTKAREAGSPENIENATAFLEALYEKKGNYKGALEMSRITTQMHDSITNQKTKQEALRKKLEYNYDKKLQTEKLKQAEENRIRDLELNRHKYFTWGLSGALILVLILAFYIIKHDKVVASQRNLQLEQKLLRSQMNPHFIFNSLTAIESFIYKNDPKEAGKYLSNFAKLMRMILENSRDEYITLSKEVKTLEHYLHLQKLRFEEKFDYEIIVDDGIDMETIGIPPMLAQPFIENSIEHGIKNMHVKGQIVVHFRKKDGHLVFEVKDNGIGIEKSMEVKKDNRLHKSLATIITKERLAMLNKRKSNKIKLVIHDLKDSLHHVLGTKVSFNIPYKEI
jgi:tetratricopeptide (TPR) repeat protein